MRTLAALVCLAGSTAHAAAPSTRPTETEHVGIAVIANGPHLEDEVWVCDVRPNDGPWANTTLQADCPQRYRDLLAVGDTCVVRVKGEPGEAPRASVLGPRRDRWLVVLVGVLLVTVVAVMRGRGLRILIALALAGVLIVGVLVPLVMRGWSPLGVAAGLSVPICVAGILLVGGPNRKSLHAIAGCLCALLAAAWLPVWLAGASHYTGLEVGFGTYFNLDIPLWYSPELARVDFPSLLLAGMILSGLGATMDVAITVSTAMAELGRTSPNLSRRARIAAGLAVGKDVFGMMAVTVLLIVAGSNTEILLLMYLRGTGGPVVSLLNHEEIGTELVRVMSCTLALGLAIPLTALFAGWGRRK